MGVQCSVGPPVKHQARQNIPSSKKHPLSSSSWHCRSPRFWQICECGLGMGDRLYIISGIPGLVHGPAILKSWVMGMKRNGFVFDMSISFSSTAKSTPPPFPSLTRGKEAMPSTLTPQSVRCDTDNTLPTTCPLYSAQIPPLSPKSHPHPPFSPFPPYFTTQGACQVSTETQL